MINWKLEKASEIQSYLILFSARKLVSEQGTALYRDKVAQSVYISG